MTITAGDAGERVQAFGIHGPDIDEDLCTEGLLRGARATRTRVRWGAAEYRTVLLRPRIRDLHGLSIREVDAIQVDLVALTVWREPAMNHEAASDAGNDHLWALLACFEQAILVTGDVLLQRQPPSFASVATPTNSPDNVGR